MNWTSEQTTAMARIRRHKKKLTDEQFRTLKGQVASGEPHAAIRGLVTILEKKQNRKQVEV